MFTVWIFVNLCLVFGFNNWFVLLSTFCFVVNSSLDCQDCFGLGCSVLFLRLLNSRLQGEMEDIEIEEVDAQCEEAINDENVDKSEIC